MSPSARSGIGRGRGERRQAILDALALELHDNPGGRITTARLASVLGVSEAALYRHFPSKARMFEGLFDHAEEAVFTQVNEVLRRAQALPRPDDTLLAAGEAVGAVLAFAREHPGITRVLLADALVGENDRLRERAHQFFERIETSLRQALARAELAVPRPAWRARTACSLMVALAEGRLHRFARGGFRAPPDAGWPQEWATVVAGLTRPGSGSGEAVRGDVEGATSSMDVKARSGAP